ncbi:MAG: hypothetical protein ACKO81_02225 [Planctomycetota bacterium]
MSISGPRGEDAWTTLVAFWGAMFAEVYGSFVESVCGLAPRLCEAPSTLGAEKMDGGYAEGVSTGTTTGV